MRIQLPRGPKEGDRIDHVERPPIPWRNLQITECGLPAEGHPTITRDQFLQKVKSEGKQRSAMSTCMTCWDTAQRHPSFDENPAASIGREVERSRWKDKTTFSSELRAIAALIERHREEFDELLEDQRLTVSIESARDRRSV